MRAGEYRSAITAGETLPLWPDMQGVSSQSPTTFLPAGPNPPPSMGGGKQRTPPFTQAPGRPLPVFEWQGKIPSLPVFFWKSAGDRSRTIARFSFLGRGVHCQPPHPLFFRAGGPPSPHGGEVGRQPPLRLRFCSVSESPWMLAGNGYNAGGCRMWCNR